MAHCALWVRTTRHVMTHLSDLDDFTEAAVRILGENVGGTLMGSDALVFAIRFEQGPDTLLRLLEPALREARFEDWCAVEIGHDFTSSIMTVGEDVDVPFGASLLIWGRSYQPPNTYGASALFIDLDGERRDDDKVIASVERRLRAPVARLWHGRSSILLAFHDNRSPDEIAAPLKVTLDDEATVSEWCLFELGSRCASRGNLNGMADFLERNYRQAKGLPVAPRPARAPASTFRDRQPSRAARHPHAYARGDRR